jgi:hypothetical protein
VKRLLLVLLTSAACGPSFQAIYEGNSRFEHCYALEENPQTPMQSKGDCWRDWSERYTYGQTRDRVQYAIARYVALSQAPTLPTDEALMNAAPGVHLRESTINAPTPTNAFEPPPKVLASLDGGSVQPPRPGELPQVQSPPVLSPPAPPSPALPASDCGGRCGGTFRACGDACGADAGAGGKKSDACRGCEKAYKACMRACFK